MWALSGGLARNHFLCPSESRGEKGQVQMSARVELVLELRLPTLIYAVPSQKSSCFTGIYLHCPMHVCRTYLVRPWDFRADQVQVYEHKVEELHSKIYLGGTLTSWLSGEDHHRMMPSGGNNVGPPPSKLGWQRNSEEGKV